MLAIQLLFYVFSAFLIVSSLMVVVVRNSVHAALFLVLAFFAAAALWLLLEAEFLALILILVYVGAVMTLFLFVVMMLDIDLEPKREGFVRYLPWGVLISALIVAALVYVILPQHFALSASKLAPQAPASYSNTAALGAVLYTDYVYPFEIAGVLLFVSIIAAITLSLRKPRSKKQDISAQLHVDPKQRMRIVDLPVERKP